MQFQIAPDEEHIIIIDNNSAFRIGTESFENVIVPELEAFNTSPPLVEENGDGTWTFNPDEINLLSSPGIPLSAEQQYANARIDGRAGYVRATYITIADGQEATYTEKAKEMDKYFREGQPSINDSPPLTANTDANGANYFEDANGLRYYYLAAEVKSFGIDPANATDTDIDSAVNNIKSNADQWTSVNSAIEATRLSYKKQINEATSKTEVSNILDQALNDLNNLMA